MYNLWKKIWKIEKKVLSLQQIFKNEELANVLLDIYLRFGRVTMVEATIEHPFSIY